MRRALGWAAVFALCALFIAALLAAAHAGQQLRCQRLVATQSPAMTTYDCTKTGAK